MKWSLLLLCLIFATIAWLLMPETNHWYNGFAASFFFWAGVIWSEFWKRIMR